MSRWESKYHTQLKRHMLDSYKVEFGEARAATLTNIWFNYHYGGCTYNKELMDIIKTWPDPKTGMKHKHKPPPRLSNQTGKKEIEDILCIPDNEGDDNSHYSISTPAQHTASIHQPDIIIIERADSSGHNEDKNDDFQKTSITPLKCKPYSNFCKPSVSESVTVVPPSANIFDNVDEGITKVSQSKPSMYTNFCKSSAEEPPRVATPPPEIVAVTDDNAFVDPYKIDDELEFIREDLDISSLEEFCYNLVNNGPTHTSNPITLLKAGAKTSHLVLNYHHTMTGFMVIDTRNQMKRKIRKTKNEDHQKVADDNIGNMLLKSMGWIEGTGLGKNEQGMVDPIVNMGQVSRHGLGTENYVQEKRKLCPGHMTSLEVNGIFVAHGISCNQNLAKAKCAQHALDYLMKRYQSRPTQSGTFTKLNHNLDITTLNFQLHLFENYNATSILYSSAEKSGATISFVDLDPDEEHPKQHSVTVKINDTFIACGTGCTPEEARLASAKQTITHLKNLGVEQYNEKGAVPGALVMSKSSGLLEHNWPVQPDEDWDAETSQSGYNRSSNGWNGWDDEESKEEGDVQILWDSRTAKNQYPAQRHLKAVPAGHESREQHYSNREPTVSKSEVEQKLHDFMHDPNVEQLAFPLEMTNADRKLVHELAEEYGFRHRSRGKPGVNRQLFVSKK